MVLQHAVLMMDRQEQEISVDWHRSEVARGLGLLVNDYYTISLFKGGMWAHIMWILVWSVERTSNS